MNAEAMPRARLDAGGTRLRLRALHVMGHGSARIARAAGVREMTIRALVRGDARTISPQLRDTITGLYDAWWDKRAPARTRAERGAATPPAAGPSPGTGAPPPPWTTTSSTPPATAPGMAGNQPPAPAPPPTSGCLPVTTAEEGRMRDHRIGLDLFTDVLDVLERHGYRPRRRPARGPGPLPHQRRGPHLRRHPGPPIRALHQPGPIPAAA